MKLPMVVLIVLLCRFQAHAQAAGHTSEEEIFAQAAASLQAGEYDAAEVGFLKVLQVDPQSVPALGNLGVLYSKTHRFAKAIAVDERALKLDPQNRSLLLNLGLAYLKEEDYIQAATYFGKLHAAFPGDSQGTILLATSLIFGDKPQAGLDLLTTSPVTTDTSSLYLLAVAYARTNQVEKSGSILNRLLSNPATHSQANFMLAKAYSDAHRDTDAVQAFREILQKEPAFPGAHRELGKVYVALQRNSEAEGELRQALQQDAEDSGAMYYLGALLVQTGKDDEGVQYLLHAQTAMPDSWAIPYYLGKTRLKQGRAQEAAVLLQASTQLNPDEPAVFYLLARALRALGRKDEANDAMSRVEALHSSALDAEKQAMRKSVTLR